jgi:hypothetical protein
MDAVSIIACMSMSLIVQLRRLLRKAGYMHHGIIITYLFSMERIITNDNI